MLFNTYEYDKIIFIIIIATESGIRKYNTMFEVTSGSYNMKHGAIDKLL
jgi:hypothetical protein